MRLTISKTPQKRHCKTTKTLKLIVNYPKFLSRNNLFLTMLIDATL